MPIARIIKRTLLWLFVAALVYGIYYASQALPIISGYGAKNMCSCVMLAGREPSDVLRIELGQFPVSLGTFVADYTDSSATGTVFGLARMKAIYRKGLGCTLLAEATEEEVRAQRYTPASSPKTNSDTVAWPQGDARANRTGMRSDAVNGCASQSLANRPMQIRTGDGRHSRLLDQAASLLRCGDMRESRVLGSLLH